MAEQKNLKYTLNWSFLIVFFSIISKLLKYAAQTKNLIYKIQHFFTTTRLSGRFAPIFYFNCGLWTLSLCTNLGDFHKLMKIKLCCRLIFKILIIHKPSLGSCEVPQKMLAKSVRLFLRLLDTNQQTNKQQTDRQAKNIYRRHLLKWYHCESGMKLF